MDVSNPAGFWNRFGASIIDSLILSIVVGIISLTVYGEFTTEFNNPIDILSTLYMVLLPVVWYGYTVGKKALGIRIAKVNGDNVGIGTMLMRSVVAGIVYALTLGIGLIVSAFMVGLRNDKRSIHDFIAGTYVTHDLP